MLYKKQLLSIGMNRKLGKKVGIFNLPIEKSCPGKSKYCKENCYSKKAERLYKHAKNKREYNYELSKKYEFPYLIMAEIIVNKIKKLRIHEGGDFYTQEYIDKWNKIMYNSKCVFFLAYTRSHNLKFKKQNNFVLYRSFDKTMDLNLMRKFQAKGELIAYLEDTEENFSGLDGFRCPGVNGLKGHEHYCGTKCNYCWEGEGHVVFGHH